MATEEQLWKRIEELGGSSRAKDAGSGTTASSGLSKADTNQIAREASNKAVAACRKELREQGGVSSGIKREVQEIARQCEVVERNTQARLNKSDKAKAHTEKQLQGVQQQIGQLEAKLQMTVDALQLLNQKESTPSRSPSTASGQDAALKREVVRLGAEMKRLEAWVTDEVLPATRRHLET